jgi:hypothetical protein
MNCNRCDADSTTLNCVGCGIESDEHHMPCEDDDIGLGMVCERCWEYLAHVENLISCPGGSACQLEKFRETPEFQSIAWSTQD